MPDQCFYYRLQTTELGTATYWQSWAPPLIGGEGKPVAGQTSQTFGFLISIGVSTSVGRLRWADNT